MTARLPRLARALSLAGALTLAGAAAAEAPFTPEQRREIGEVVRDYLLKNPELLKDVMVELERREGEAQRASQKAALDRSREALLNSGRDVVAGNPKGDVTVVEFFDYNCGYCKRAMTDLQALIKSDPKLRLVLKDFPVLGPDSVEASRVGLAAMKQLSPARQFEYHARLMETRARVNGERATALAKEMGLDLARLQKDLEGAEVKQTIQDNVVLGDKLGLTGTPAFVIGDEVISGAVGLEPMRKTVAGVRQCGKAVC